MNHSTLKKFAAKTRVDLMEQVGARLKYVLSSDSVELREKAAQVKQLREVLKHESEKALVERVAYTWFNRLTALRFMDAEGRHPFGCRVISATPGNTQPEILQQVRNGSVPEGFKLDQQRVNDLLDGRVPSSNAQAEVYRILVVAACNYYHQLMPFVFEKIADYTELLLPEELLSEASVAEGFRSAISDEDCREVELIGWLYQYYIAEKKDAVMARKKAVPKEDIPAVTQLFTPHWIVRYMVENSLGRLWMQSRPSSKLVDRMDYYIPDAEQDHDAANESNAASSHSPSVISNPPLSVESPEEIRLIDPACGSGHILTYAFDLLYAIYEEEGYEPSSIPGHILTKNLHGVEIDERAAELAYFALMMKAQQHYGRFLRRQLRAEPPERIVPEICCLEEIHFEEGELKAYMDALDIGDLFTAPVLTLMHQFEEAKNFGSLIQPVVDDIGFLQEAIENKDPGDELFLRETHRKVETVLQQAEMLGQRYQVVVANPPYMGGRYMEKSLKAWAETFYPDSKSDTYALFIEKSHMLAVDQGFFALITMQSWMFLQSFGALRKKLFSECSLVSMLHTGPGVFPDLGAFNVLTTAFVFCNHSEGEASKALFIKANEDPNLERKRRALSDPQSHYLVSIVELKSVPDFPLVYWLSSDAIQNFGRFPQLRDVCPPKQGLATGDNQRFVRFWHEVSNLKTFFGARCKEEVFDKRSKWVPYNKGGNYRKWYGNNTHVLAFDQENYDLLAESGNHLPSRNLYFKRGIVYSLFGFENFGVRFKEEGFVFDVSGSSMFPNKDVEVVLAFLCSNVAFFYLKALAPTVNFQVGDLARLPLPTLADGNTKQKVVDLAKSCIELCRLDWDAWETSWGFTKSPVLKAQQKSLQLAWNDVCSKHDERRSQLRKNEERINNILIKDYRLSGEVSPEVLNRDLSIRPLDRDESVTAFISYAVGCMLGRYSLDKPGLILANAGETVEDYLKQVPEPQFMPDSDNILPVLDGEWFEDDIATRFREFLKVTFGEATLRENIQFIEESLGKDLRKYFVADFYKDHLKTYKKRPIYWLFQSPKKSFQALIYLHRYNRDTVNLLLNDYLREFQNKLQNRRKHLDEILASESTSARDKTAATKEQTKIDKMLPELADWERDVILPLAQQRLEIDLDDGVKQNYPKFGAALAKIPGVS